MQVKKTVQMIVGLTLIVALIAAEGGLPIGTLVNAYVPPPRTTTGLKKLLML